MGGDAPGGGEGDEDAYALRMPTPIRARGRPGLPASWLRRLVRVGGHDVGADGAVSSAVDCNEESGMMARARTRSVSEPHDGPPRQTAAAGSAPGASVPLCWPSTQTSQAPVANRGGEQGRRACHPRSGWAAAVHAATKNPPRGRQPPPQAEGRTGSNACPAGSFDGNAQRLHP